MVFIYVRDKIKEIDKIPKGDNFIENGRRYAIARGHDDISGLLRFDFGILQVSNESSIYSPKDNLRFKMQGGRCELRTWWCVIT